LRTPVMSSTSGLIAVCAAGLTARKETQTTTKTKIEIKGGKDLTVIGCLEQRISRFNRAAPMWRRRSKSRR
jgi:hypothetical protein